MDEDTSGTLRLASKSLVSPPEFGTSASLWCLTQLVDEDTSGTLRLASKSLVSPPEFGTSASLWCLTQLLDEGTTDFFVSFRSDRVSEIVERQRGRSEREDPR